MDIRSAILAAASHIERNPRAFQYCEIAVPERGAPECGTPGCAIGWIAHFTGREFPRTGGGLSQHHQRTIMRVHDDGNVCMPVLGIGHDAFYGRMDSLASYWQGSAAGCARALRLYADAFHPATEQPRRIDTVPDWKAIATAHPSLAPVGGVR